jgi:transcriptional regulator with AAA-type ATPase domain
MSQDRIQWLRQNTALSPLAEEILAAIASAIQVEEMQENRRLILEESQPTALYILKAGRLEAYHTSTDSSATASSLLPGSILHLKELLLDQPTMQTVITLSDCELWVIPRDAFLAIVQQYPDLNRLVSQQLAAELNQMTAQLAFEQDRQTALRPYFVPKVKQGIVGASRYASRLRNDIRKASGDRQPVLIFGEPGLGKDNIAALVHFGSNSRKEPLIKVNCDTLQANGAELFGRAGGKPGLIEWLGAGTLMLNNVQEI